MAPMGQYIFLSATVRISVDKYTNIETKLIEQNTVLKLTTNCKFKLLSISMNNFYLIIQINFVIQNI